MEAAEHFELPEMPGYISTEQAAKLLGISKNRVYQYINEQRLPAFRAGNMILLPITAVKDISFKMTAVGRPRKKILKWRTYCYDRLLVTDVRVQIRPSRQTQLVERLQALHDRHMFSGTVARYISRDESAVSICLIWKEAEMPDEETRRREYEAFQGEFADVLDWKTAQSSTREGIIYT